MGLIQDTIESWPKSLFLVLGIGLAGYYYSTQANVPLVDETQLSIAKAEMVRNQKKVEEILSFAKDKSRFQEEVEKVSQAFRRVVDYLPRDLDMQDLLKKIYSEARSAGVELSDFKPNEVVQKEFYDEIPMTIKIKGTYQQLVSFLANVSKIPRIINIRNIEIAIPTMVDGYPHMQLTGQLVGYRYKEGGPTK